MKREDNQSKVVVNNGNFKVAMALEKVELLKEDLRIAEIDLKIAELEAKK